MAAQKNAILCFNKSTVKSSTESLFDSIHRRKKSVTILTLIQEGADINARDSNGYTPLLLSSKYGLKTVVNLLIYCGAIIDSSECPLKRTLLHYASGYGWIEIVQSLINRDCSVPCEESMAAFPTIHAKDMEGRTALHLASLQGNLKVVKCLIEKGANLVTRNECGETALHDASGGGHLKVVRCLVDKGADLEARDELGETALHKASDGGHLKIVKYLLDKGADMEVKSCKSATPLLVAAKGSSIDIIVLLINSGANVDCCDGDKRTVLHYASQLGCIEIVQYLVKRVSVSPFILNQVSKMSWVKNTCPTIHARDMDGRTALNIASFYGHLEVVKILVAEGVDLNVRNKDGKTALYEAALFRYSDIVKFLVAEGADTNVRNKDEKTALHEASFYGDLETVKCLVEGGADINVKSCKGATPLLIAARFSHQVIVDLLVNSGASLDGCDELKCTLLHYASENGWMQIVQSIVKSASDLNARDNDEETALFFACRKRQLNCVQYLLKAGASWDIRNKKGYLLLDFTKNFNPRVKFIKLFIEAGAYLTPVDYYEIVDDLQLKIQLLQDVKFCCQAIINKFNAHDLPALYKLPVSASLPRIEKMIIGSNSRMAQTIEQTVKLEIQKNGYCNVLEVCPVVLSLFSVRSVLEYYDAKKSVS